MFINSIAGISEKIRKGFTFPMEIYHDNSAIILHSSERFRKVQLALLTIFTITGVGGIICSCILSVLKALDLEFAKPVIIFSRVCLAFCMFASLILILQKVTGAYENIYITTDMLCLVSEICQDTLAIIAGEQELYLNTTKYDYELIPVQQSLKLCLVYSYSPIPPQKHARPRWHQIFSWSPKPSDVPEPNVGNLYQAFFILNFSISPRAITDAGRQALMSEFTDETTLKQIMSSWILAGFCNTKSGNLEIAQEYLDKNPYGFCEMQIDFIKTTYCSDKTLTII